MEEMNENPALEAGKEEDEYKKTSLKTKTMTTMMILNPIDGRRDINIDEYLSSDDTPDYKTQTNNYSDDDEKIVNLHSSTC
jgi:RNA polymerase sigma-54 factor